MVSYCFQNVSNPFLLLQFLFRQKEITANYFEENVKFKIDLFYWSPVYCSYIIKFQKIHCNRKCFSLFQLDF